jgi:MATE family multidrug resistance protein
MDAPRPSPVREELWSLIRLAGPLALIYLGNHLLGVVETAIVGRLGETALAAMGLGNGVYFAVAVIGVGLMLGLDPVIAQAVGAKEHSNAYAAFRQAPWMALFSAVPLVASVIALALSLEALGIGRAVAHDTFAYVSWRSLGLYPFLLLVGARTYLQAYDRTLPLVLGIVLAHVLNVPLTYLLVFGDAGLVELGLPALGVPSFGAGGAGITSAICTAVQLGVAFVGLPRRPRERHRFDRAIVRRAFRVGVPIALTLTAEVGAFALSGFFAGLLGQSPLAAHNVALTLASTTFQMPLAIGAATAVRVGQAVGRSDVPGARRAGFLGFGLAATVMLACAGAFLAVPGFLASLITNKPSVIAAALPLVAIAAAFQLFDGLQAAGAGALRGATDTRFAFLANLVGYYALGLPIGVLTAFAFDAGPAGLWWGLSIGLFVVSVALAIRFHFTTRRSIRRA